MKRAVWVNNDVIGDADDDDVDVNECGGYERCRGGRWLVFHDFTSARTRVWWRSRHTVLPRHDRRLVHVHHWRRRNLPGQL